jgi:hypothetical protein
MHIVSQSAAVGLSMLLTRRICSCQGQVAVEALTCMLFFKNVFSFMCKWANILRFSDADCCTDVFGKRNLARHNTLKDFHLW